MTETALFVLEAQTLLSLSSSQVQPSSVCLAHYPQPPAVITGCLSDSGSLLLPSCPHFSVFSVLTFRALLSKAYLAGKYNSKYQTIFKRGKQNKIANVKKVIKVLCPDPV